MMQTSFRGAACNVCLGSLVEEGMASSRDITPAAVECIVLFIVSDRMRAMQVAALVVLVLMLAMARSDA